MDDATRSRMALTAGPGSNGPSQMPPAGGGGGGGARAPLIALNTTQLPALLGGPTQLPGAAPTQLRGGKMGGAELEMIDLGGELGTGA